ncbi:ATP-grasp fold amidoligase family protein [Vagococcus lutrae]|uniref:ATP-grasp fold amidoligase family protein n=1 Tax=Vagococcus lutrae TaxID=81947 RepID=UPI00288DF724|nr:ATP-grasp fold amidoligase family protein [Vagococcus lutrae]MDT2819125.1 ATP-grasp fold amidoligase family protein [Vagococcus lutrae]MDT2843918.1 ATP-grasp fold amidoligase family protein [Vagococcus lutrae]
MIRNSNIVSKIYHAIKNNLYKLSEERALKFAYLITTGKRLNLKNPTTFNEKIQWLKLNWKSNLVVKCTDKYAVREYIESKGLSEILNELYFVYDDADEIIWEELPSAFALKTNNGCKTMFITKNKYELDKIEVKNKMNEWLESDYGLSSIEPHYSQIPPKIICEKYLENTCGEFPIDYKIFCFNGEPKFISVIFERTKTHKFKRFFMDLNWNILNFEKDKTILTEIPKKPINLERMLEYSYILAEDFPFVRVDFYEMEGKVIFGELTFTPTSGMATYYTPEAQLLLGNWLTLPKKIKEY